jgi:F0F1-type ATP synthase membrane subunit b/b'
MTFSTTFLINAGSLFDFDLTFVIELALFTLLAFIVTNKFVGPISQQLDERAEFINYTLRKSTILLSFGYERLTECVELLTTEINEMNRQVKLTRNYVNTNFEEEVASVQSQNAKLLSKLKGDLSIQSAFLFSNIKDELASITDKFFAKKFQSAS